MNVISFVVPVFRNEGSIRLTLSRIKEHLSEHLSEYDFQMIFVNDGSDDNSLLEILELKEEYPKQVDAISFSRNFGQVPAMVAGYKIARGQLVINIAADLQDPIELISDMVKEWERGSKIVICYRTDRQESFISSAASNFFHNLINFANPRIPKGGFDFTLMDQKVVKEFNKINEKNRFFQGDIAGLGYSIKFIPYVRLKREIGESQATFSKRIKYFIDGLLNTSYLPIRMMSFLGILISLTGFIYAFIVIIDRLFYDYPYEGWAPLMVVLLTVGGLIMLMLGVIGEYIWRIYDEVRGKPYYIIEEEYIS